MSNHLQMPPKKTYLARFHYKNKHKCHNFNENEIHHVPLKTAQIHADRHTIKHFTQNSKKKYLKINPNNRTRKQIGK